MPRKTKFTKPLKGSEEWWDLILDPITNSVENEAEGAPVVDDPFAGTAESTEWQKSSGLWFFLPWDDKEFHCYGEVLNHDLHAGILDVTLYFPHQPAGGRTTIPVSGQMRWLTKKQFDAAEMCGWTELKERFVRSELSDGSYELASLWFPDCEKIVGTGIIYSATFPDGRSGTIRSPFCIDIEELSEEKFAAEVALLQKDSKDERAFVIE